VTLHQTGFPAFTVALLPFSQIVGDDSVITGCKGEGMYDVVRGPLVWVAFLVLAVGLIYQVFQFFSLTKRKDPIVLPSALQPQATPKKGVSDRIAEWAFSLKKTVWYSHSLIMVMTSIFHFCLIVTPFFVLGHNLLLDESWRVSFWSFSEGTTDKLTFIVFLCAAFFLIRRLFVPRVRAITSAYDYLILLITAAPFLTGYFAYHQWFDYRTMIILHILAGEVMLVSLPFTKLGHMLFFFLYRFLIGSEHSFSQGTRSW
jgi:nitrate reductase gamma subunit